MKFDRQRTTRRPAAPRAPKPRAARVAFVQPLTITIEHPGSTIVSFEVTAMDISRTGVKVAHRNFIYPGSPAQIAFMRGKQVVLSIRGTVARCDYTGLNRHEIGIAFDRPLASEDLPGLTSGI
jgi:hypothetical protein